MKRRRLKVLSIVVNLVFLNQIFAPTYVWALTSGPNQPEINSFTPAGTTELVNLFSGDFNYNVPLMNVGGYPVNLSYKAGVSMEQEASWVGLGWTLNAGSINRQLRGLPDDFNGDAITKKKYTKPNETWGGIFSTPIEFAGFGDDDNKGSSKKDKSEGYWTGPSITPKIGYSYNNYNGAGLEFGLSASSGLSKLYGIGPSFGLSASSSNGMTLASSLSVNYVVERNDGSVASYRSSIGMPSINSRSGLTEISLRVQGGSTNFGLGGFNISKPIFTTSPPWPMKSHSLSVGVAGGWEMTWADLGLAMDGYYNRYSLAEETIDYAAFGYNNLENHYSFESAGGEYYQLDYSRESEGQISKGIPYLPMASADYDMFYASGNGMQMGFRAHRYDIGTLHEATVNSVSTSGSLGLDGAFGNVAKFGMDVGGAYSESVSGKWENTVEEQFRFKSADELGLDYDKPYFFKATSEINRGTNDYFSSYADGHAITLQLSGKRKGIDVKEALYADQSGFNSEDEPLFNQVANFNGDMQQMDAKPDMANNIVGLNAYEASTFGFDKQVSYKDDADNWVDQSRIGEESGGLNRKAHHFSEFQLTQMNGSRYIYGLPVYNKVQKAVSFRLNDDDSYSCDKQVTYTSDHTKVNNSKGNDELFMEETTPAYPHSFLLTGITSPDYIDVTGDGITDDDVGSAVKFNYSRPSYADGDYYKWRAPYAENTANVDEALAADDQDQMASFIYGEKEVYYLQSIESKNYVAIFHLNDRKDGLGVNDEDGGRGSDQKLKYLEKIELFAKEEYIKSSNPRPVKTVHFTYSYTLCPGVPNHADYDPDNNDYSNPTPGNEHGKLTLDEVYFTYGWSNKGSHTKYLFAYDGENPEYDQKSSDRWGVYEPFDQNACSDETKRSLDIYPSANQSDDRNSHAAAWSMTSVRLPSGGRIDVSYESDDYSHVQDQTAMVMVDIENARRELSDQGSSGSDIEMHSGKKYNENDDNFYQYLIFDLDDNDISISETQSDANEIVKNLYGADIFKSYWESPTGPSVFFDFFVKVGDVPNLDADHQYEYVSGFAQIEDIGATHSDPSNPGTHYDKGYIKLKGAKMSSRKRESQLINPIAKESWTYFIKNLNKHVNPGSEPKGSDVSAFRGLMNAFAVDSRRMLQGMYKAMRGQDYARYFVKNKSMVRLSKPDRSKKGDGIRVKSIRIKDNWKAMTSSSFDELDGEFGQDYFYTRKDVSGEDVSSGVAANEPSIYYEECALVQLASTFEYDRKLVANDFTQYAKPMGKKYLPGASVGYEKVTVKAYNPTDSWVSSEKISGTATGRSENYFHTAREFPTVFKQTRIDQENNWLFYVIPFLFSNTSKYLGLTQGFYVETNDMHGKPKAVAVYDEDGRKVSQVDYEYIRDQIPVIYPDGSTNNNTNLDLREVDISFETKHIREKSGTGSAQYNADFSFFGLLPAGIPMVWPSGSRSISEMRYTTCTKHVHSKSMLKAMKSDTRGVIAESEQKAWDASNGMLLRSSSLNEFKEDVIGFTYPAYWAYENMGSKAKRQHKIIEDVSFGAGNELVLPSGNQVQLKDGDKVALFESKTLESELAEAIKQNVGSVATDPLSFWDLLRSRHHRILNYINPYDASKGYNNAELWYWQGYLINRSGDVFSTADLTYGTSHQIDLLIIDPIETNQMAAAIGSVVTLKSDILDENGAYQNTDQVLVASALEFSERWKTNCCGYKMPVPDKVKPCRDGPCDVVNPYVKGILGKWRPVRNWAVMTNRTTSMVNSGDDPLLQQDGRYENFAPFWEYSGSWSPIATPESNYWQRVTEITEYDRNGIAIEQNDALDLPSATLYGYDGMMAIASAENSRYTDMAFDGFEGYNYKKAIGTQTQLLRTADLGTKCVYAPHFGFTSMKDNGVSYLSDAKAHSGKYSLKLDPVSMGTNFIDLKYAVKATENQGAIAVPFKMDEGDCLDNLALEAGKEYAVSVWVTGEVYSAEEYVDARLRVKFDGVSDPDIIVTATGPVIEGWQRMLAYFTVPVGCTDVSVRYKARNNSIIYFDDFRMHPKMSVMTSYVYDEENLRLNAVLNANNYATFYEYDAEGSLVRTKKETDEGIVTLEENRSHVVQ